MMPAAPSCTNLSRPGMKVVDVFRYKHGRDCKQYSWFSRSKPQGEDSARVDYALVDEAWKDKIEQIHYLEDPIDRAHSDHAPLLLDLPLDLVMNTL